MKTQILISLNKYGLRDIALIAETKQECKEVIEAYQKFEPEILSFLTAMRKKTKKGVSNSFGIKEKLFLGNKNEQ